MADVFSREQRSEIMAKVKGRENKATEIRLLKLFREERISGWRRRSLAFGKPDFTFPSKRLAIFVDGCFWHGCPVHGTVPASNRAFWQNKLERNKSRDKLVSRTLKASGWTVLRIWQHELREPDKVTKRIHRALSAAAR